MSYHRLRAGAAASLVVVAGWLVWQYIDRSSRSESGPSADEPPALECPAQVDLGAVEHGTLVSAGFTVKNSGGRQLVLSEFRSSCACQSVEVKRASGFMRATEVRLGPGEAVEMRLVMSINGRGYESFQSVVYFGTNIPDRPEAAVLVVAPRILAGVTAIPSSVTVGPVQINTPVVHTVNLYDMRNSSKKVLRVQAEDPNRVTARLIPTIDDDGMHDKTDHGAHIGTVEVVVDTTTTGSIASNVFVYLDDRVAVPEVIRVVGRVAAPVEASPASLNFPRSSSSGPLYSGVCLVRSNLEGEFHLTVAEAPEGVKVSVGNADPSSSRMRVVTVELTPAFLKVHPDGIGFAVRMSATVAGKQQDLEIPVRVSRPAEDGQP